MDLGSSPLGRYFAAWGKAAFSSTPSVLAKSCVALCRARIERLEMWAASCSPCAYGLRLPMVAWLLCDALPLPTLPLPLPPSGHVASLTSITVSLQSTPLLTREAEQRLGSRASYQHITHQQLAALGPIPPLFVSSSLAQTPTHGLVGWPYALWSFMRAAQPAFY